MNRQCRSTPLDAAKLRRPPLPRGDLGGCHCRIDCYSPLATHRLTQLTFSGQMTVHYAGTVLRASGPRCRRHPSRFHPCLFRHRVDSACAGSIGRGRHSGSGGPLRSGTTYRPAAHDAHSPRLLCRITPCRGGRFSRGTATVLRAIGRVESAQTKRKAPRRCVRHSGSMPVRVLAR